MEKHYLLVFCTLLVIAVCPIFPKVEAQPLPHTHTHAALPMLPALPSLMLPALPAFPMHKAIPLWAFREAYESCYTKLQEAGLSKEQAEALCGAEVRLLMYEQLKAAWQEHCTEKVQAETGMNETEALMQCYYCVSATFTVLYPEWWISETTVIGQDMQECLDALQAENETEICQELLQEPCTKRLTRFGINESQAAELCAECKDLLFLFIPSAVLEENKVETMQQLVVGYNQNIEQAPALLKGFVGNERIALHLRFKDGTEQLLWLKTEKGVIKELSLEPIESSLEVHLSEETIEKIVTSPEPIKQFQAALGKEIQYKALKPGTGLKLFFGNLALRLWSLFS